MKALLVIDYSNDFVAPEGVLTAGQAAQALAKPISQLMKQFIAARELVIVANDTHEKKDVKHPEYPLFPPHNIRGTWGQELYGEVKTTFDALCQHDHCLYTPKRRYSAFEGTNIPLWLQEQEVREVWLVGVATDICILHTAIGAFNRGYPLVIPTNGVASFNARGHAWALEHFKNALGAQLVQI